MLSETNFPNNSLSITYRKLLKSLAKYNSGYLSTKAFTKCESPAFGRALTWFLDRFDKPNSVAQQAALTIIYLGRLLPNGSSGTSKVIHTYRNRYGNFDTALHCGKDLAVSTL